MSNKLTDLQKLRNLKADDYFDLVCNKKTSIDDDFKAGFDACKELMGDSQTDWPDTHTEDLKSIEQTLSDSKDYQIKLLNERISNLESKIEEAKIACADILDSIENDEMHSIARVTLASMCERV